MTNLIKKYWFWPLVVGVVIRLVLMPITLHPDLWGHSFTAYFLAYEGVLNPYEHLLSLAADHPLVTNFGVADIFIYPPLTYFTFGIFRILVMPLADANIIPYLWENNASTLEFGKLAWHLFLFKLPYLFIDIGLAFLLAKLFDDKKKKRLAFMFWMFNPVTIYATFMVGQFDLLPTFLSVLALYFVKEKKPYWALVSLGIGGAYKMFPLLFILPVAFMFSEKFVERIKYVLAGLVPFFLVSLPYLGSSAFRQMVLFTPKSQKSLFMIFKMTGAEGIYPYIVLLFILYFAYFYFKKAANIKNANFIFIFVLLITYSLTHFHPQWFLWITPFLIISLINSKFKSYMFILALFLIWLFITFTFEASLTYGLFNPLNSNLSEAVSLSEVISKYTDINMLKSLVRSIFAAASAMLLYTSYRDA